MASIVEAGVKSAWQSKINWTQAIGWAASAGAAFGLDIPKEQLLDVVLGIQGVVGIATWVQKTWFTTTLTPSSAAKV